MEILLFLLLVYGVSNIIVYNTIPIWEKIYNLIDRFSPRYLGKMLSCMMCCSTWVGFIFSFLFITLGYEQFSPFMSFGIDNIWFAVFLDGCIASGVTWILHTTQEALERTNQTDEE
jgi:hypothetical protein